MNAEVWIPELAENVLYAPLVTQPLAPRCAVDARPRSVVEDEPVKRLTSVAGPPGLACPNDSARSRGVQLDPVTRSVPRAVCCVVRSRRIIGTSAPALNTVGRASIKTNLAWSAFHARSCCPAPVPE